MKLASILALWVALAFPTMTTGFSVGLSTSLVRRSVETTSSSSNLVLQSSFAADGSEYSSSDSSSDVDDDMDDAKSSSYDRNYRDDQDETPTVELSPVPMSKNAGNRFVAVFWDSQLNQDATKDALDLHNDRIALTEEHVMFCRKTSLYNETFNQDSMVDVLWSLPMYEKHEKETRADVVHSGCLLTVFVFLSTCPTVCLRICVV